VTNSEHRPASHRAHLVRRAYEPWVSIRSGTFCSLRVGFPWEPRQPTDWPSRLFVHALYVHARSVTCFAQPFPCVQLRHR
jgi:hypothetical protein